MSMIILKDANAHDFPTLRDANESSRELQSTGAASPHILHTHTSKNITETKAKMYFFK